MFAEQDTQIDKLNMLKMNNDEIRKTLIEAVNLLFLSQILDIYLPAGIKYDQCRLNAANPLQANGCFLQPQKTENHKLSDVLRG